MRGPRPRSSLRAPGSCLRPPSFAQRLPGERPAASQTIPAAKQPPGEACSCSSHTPPCRAHCLPTRRPWTPATTHPAIPSWLSVARRGSPFFGSSSVYIIIRGGLGPVKSPLLSFSSSLEKILKAPIFLRFYGKVVEGASSSPPPPTPCCSGKSVMLLKVVGAVRGHSLSVCPRLEEETTLWYLREAVCCRQCHALKCLRMKGTQQTPCSRFPSRVSRAPYTFFFLLYSKPSDRQIRLLSQVSFKRLLCISHPENPHPLERSDGRRGSHSDFCLFYSAFY